MEVTPALLTAVYAAELIQAALALSMFVAYQVYGRRVRYLGQWAIASLLVTVGYGLYALAGRIPSAIPIVAGNGSFIAGMYFVMAGAADLSGRRGTPGWPIGGMLLSIPLLLFFGYVVPSFAVRNLIVSLSVAVCSMVSALYLLDPAKPEMKKVTILGVWVFMAYATFYLLRSALLVWTISKNGLSGLISTRVEVAILLGALVLFVFLGIAFFTMMGGLFVQDLRKSLRKNEDLLLEIQHRTKNNIALISSLVSLQENEVTDAAAKQAFRELKARLETITRVYRLLGRAEDGQHADIKKYLEDLCSGIRDSVASSSSNVAFQCRAEPRVMDSLTLIPLGLIVNELAANALKHGFPNKRPGTIRVQFTSGDNECVLEVTDNGVGFDTDLLNSESHAEGRSIGMALVYSLADQLDGVVTIESTIGQGTRGTLRFAHVDTTTRSALPAT